MSFCKKKIIFGFIVLVILLVTGSCAPYEDTTTSTGTGSGGGGGGASCSTGYCLNNGQCCPKSAPDYTYGNHGYAAGCYASCPYVGDCGASTQCF